MICLSSAVEKRLYHVPDVTKASTDTGSRLMSSMAAKADTVATLNVLNFWEKRKLRSRRKRVDVEKKRKSELKEKEVDRGVKIRGEIRV